MPVQVGSAYGKIILDASGVRAGVAEAQRHLNGLQGTVGTVAKGIATATAGIALAVGGIAAVSVKTAAEFDTQMRNVNSIAKLPEQQFKALEDQVVSLSTKFPQSAETMAAGLYSIQSSGFNAQEAMKLLEVSARGASAGLTDTETSSKALTAVINAYGLSVDDADHVMDVMFKTVDRGVLSFEELAGNIGDVVGTANVAGVSIEELGAAFATMTKGGISAAEASTALNQLMLTYIQPSEDAKDLAHQLGIEFSAQALQSKGLAGAVKELSDKVGLYEVVATGADEKVKEQVKGIDQQIRALRDQKGATSDAARAQKDAIDSQVLALEAQKRAITGNSDAAKAQRAALTNQIATLRDQKSAVGGSNTAIDAQIRKLENQKAALIDSKNTNIDYNVVMAEMSKRTGLTAEQLSTLFPNVRALKAALSLTRQEGQVFEEELGQMGKAAGATQTAFAEQAKGTEFQFTILKNKVTAILISLGVAILPIINRIMGQLASALDSPQVKAAIDTLIAAITSIGNGDIVGGLSKILGPELANNLVSTVTTIIGILQSLLAGDFKSVLEKITIALAGLFGNEFANNFYNTVLGIVNFVTGTVIPGLQQFANFLQTQVLPVILQVFGWILDNREQLIGVLEGVVAGFIAFQAISGVVGTITAIIAAVSAMSGAISAAGGIIAAIVAILGGPLTIIIVAIAALISLLVAAWVNDWGGIQEKTQAVVTFITDAIQKFLAWAGPAWEKVSKLLSQAWEVTWKAIQEVVNRVLGVIRPLLEAWQAATEGNWKLFGQKLREAWDALWQLIYDIIQKALELILAYWRGAWDTFLSILNNIIPTIISTISGLVNQIWTAITSVDWLSLGGQIIQGIANGITNGIEAIKQAALAAAQAALDAAKGFLGIQSPSRRAEEEVGRPLVEGVEVGIRRGWTDIQNTFKSLAPSLSGVQIASQRNLQPSFAGASPARSSFNGTLNLNFNFPPGIEKVKQTDLKDTVRDAVYDAIGELFPERQER